MMISKVDWSYKEALERLKKPVLIAAKLGIHEFVHEVLKANQCSALFRDEERRNIFLLAISYRKEKVFSLIHDQMSSIRDYTTNCRDSEDDNILHLAAKFVPSSQIPGSALQMQRELQWFKFGFNFLCSGWSVCSVACAVAFVLCFSLFCLWVGVLSFGFCPVLACGSGAPCPSAFL
ncbi:hypothetical protein QYF36_024888 [Acer negundo]|nr:hypothetical protein QYF36_024888 [Acer negundo]